MTESMSATVFLKSQVMMAAKLPVFERTPARMLIITTRPGNFLVTIGGQANRARIGYARADRAEPLFGNFETR